MNNFTQTIFTSSRNSFNKLVAICSFLLLCNLSFGQTVVTVGDGATVTCPATPTATWTTPPAGVTFSNWSRGSGVTCGSAATALSGSTFSSTSATASVTANKFYSVTLTANSSTNVNLSNIVWNTAVSSGTCSFAAMYSNNGGAVTQFGTTGTSLTTNTFTGNVNIAAGTSLVLYMVPFNATSGSTVRWVNGSTITVTASAAAPTVNGTIAAGEYGTHTNGSNQETNAITWFNTWDATNLYLGIGTTSNNSNEAAVVYLDIDPIAPVNGGANSNGTNVGLAYDRGTFNPAMRADFLVYFKNGYYEYRKSDGAGGWGAATTTGLTYAQSGAGAGFSQEISIPWSAITGGAMPASYNWFAYKVYDGGAGNNGIYGQVPANNPGGAQNVSAYTLSANRYYTVSTTTLGSSTLPFSRISYCQPIGTTSNGFGAASFWDFTVNPGSGFQVARSATAGGDWTISGNLVVGSGTLYFGSGGSTYGASTIANVNIVGGSLNMDQTSVAMNVSGNVTIASGASLVLSGTTGGDVNVAGNWNNAGTFTPNTRAVGFNGASAQTMTGATTFDFMTMNGAGGLTLLNNATVNRTLTLTTGKITLGTNTLTVTASPATISGGSATSYIVTNSTGALIRNAVGNTATSFPVGLAASYTPLTVTNTGTANNLSLVVSSPPSNAVTDATKIVNLEWNLNSAGAGAVGTIAFNWNTGNQGASYSTTGSGELGNYTAGPNYAITSIGTMSGQTKSVTGVALSSGNNKFVLGNAGAVYLVAPSNDLCSNATALTIDAAAISGTLIGANPTSGLTYAVTKNDVWYSFIPVNTGTHTITVNFASGPELDLDIFNSSCPTSGAAPNLAHTTNATSEVVSATFTAGITYYIRVVDYNTNASTFTINVSGPPATLNTSVSTLSFGTTQAPLTQSSSQSFNLTGFSLTGAPGSITVTAPNTDYQVSNNNSTWGSTTTIAYSSSTLSATPVYVRFTPQSSGTKTGNINFSGGGVATPPTVALTGTSVLPSPVATAATNIAATSFDANWNPVLGASSGYLLDVSTSPTFGTTGSATINEGYSTGTTAPSGWTFTAIGGTYTSVGNYGASSPSLQMDATNDRVLTTTYPGNASQLTLWLKGQGTDGISALLVEGFNGTSWVTIQNILVSLTTTTYTYNASSTPALPANLVQFRFTYTKSSGNLAFDDVSVTYDTPVPSFVSGYNAKPISGQSTVTSTVTGLTADTVYYYRLRATDGAPSAYSNVITVNPASRGGSVTVDQTICSGTQPATLTLSGNNGTVVKWQKSSDTSFTSPTDIANTSLTLNGATIGNLTVTTYFRAVVQSYSNPTADSNYATVTVTQLPTYANLQYPASETICPTGALTVYGRVYQAGVTEAAGAGTGITAEFGYSTSNTDPSTWTNWSTASFNVQVGNNDEYTYAFTPPSSGTFYYTFRYRQGTCVWLYGGYNGGFWNGTTNINGVLTVDPNHTIALTSGSATSTVCQNTAITTPIVYTVGGGATSAGVTGLPSGMNGTFSGGALTLNGTPTAVGTFNYTVTTTGNSCTVATATGTITVNGPVTPTFTAVAPICAGASLSALPTTSNNGYTGTWSPALDNTTTTTYTFTPTAGQCATTATLTITVNPNITPTFTAVAPICAGASLSPLPTTSNNGYTGTWSPALDNTTTTTYTFTPTAGQCATTATLTITVNPNVTPTFTAVAPICAGASLSALPTTSNNGYTGTWSPALDNTTTTTYTFTPDAGQCATTATLTITVTPNVTPTFTPVGTICAGSPLSALPTTSNNGITGTWSPALDNTTTTVYTFTPTAGQCATTATLTITVGGTVIWNGTAWDNVTGPTSTDSAVFTGNYTIGADFNACSIQVNSGAVVSVTSGFNVNLYSSITVASGGSFILNNNANLYQANASAVNTGNIIVKRNSNPLIRLDYTLWSSPVAGQGLLAFSPLTSISPTIRFYTYNTSSNLYSSIASPSTTNFATGTGYLIRLPFNHPTAPAVWTGSFTGVPNNGTKTIALTNIDETHQFNAVGNPYPSPISISQFATDNAGLIEPTLYFWRKTNNTNSPSYCTWNTTSGTFGDNGEAYTNTPNGVIQTGQGFIVEAKGAASALTFNNGQRAVNNANQFFKSSTVATAADEAHRVWLNLTGTGSEFSQAVVGYFTNATLGSDDYDSKYFNDGAVALNMKIAGTDYVIQGRPAPFDATDVVPLNYKVTTAGTYNFTLDHVDGLFSGGAQNIYIKDNSDATYHNITSGSYSFTSAAGTFADRFELVYTDNALNTNNNTFDSNSIVVYHQQNDVVINTGVASMATVRIFDIRGRLLVEKKDINSSETRVNVGTTNQVLVVQVTTTEGLKATKKVIN